MANQRTRHRPESSVLYAVVRDHLDDFLRTAREHGAMPAFIEKTFRAFMKCGLPEHGFVRVCCACCGHDDIVAFSCKRRGVCPSCSGRAMADGAAHLVDHVLPPVPYRQWVVSFPFELNAKLAFQPDLLGAVERVVMDALSGWQKTRSGGGQGGGILVRHRFGGALNLHIHSHVLMTDGVYRRLENGTLAFEQGAKPTQQELDALAEELHRRIHTLFKRRGQLPSGDGVGNLEEERDALAACVNVALGPGQRERRGPALSVVAEDDVERPSGGCVARAQGLNLYASPPIAAADRERLEQLCRYLLRGPITLGRLKQRDDGMLTYRLKKADRRGNTVLLLTPQQLLMRLCSLIPAPRHPTRRYFGILAAGAKDRRRVVPKPTVRKKKRCAEDGPPPPVQSPVKWSELLKRVWGLDALDCPRCHARMTAVAVIEDPAEIARYLAHTGQATVHGRARGPPVDADAA